MTIQLTADVRVRALDERCWAVEVRRVADASHRLTKHPGRESWAITGYHGTLLQAARAAAEMVLRVEPGEHDLAAVVRRLDELAIDIGRERIRAIPRSECHDGMLAEAGGMVYRFDAVASDQLDAAIIIKPEPATRS